MLARASQLERVSRWLARREQELQVRLARELVTRFRSLTGGISELDRELELDNFEQQSRLPLLTGSVAAAGLRRSAEASSSRFGG